MFAFEDHILETDRETLSVFTLDVPGETQCFLLHGAGGSEKERLRPLALELAKAGISSVGFDFSGHGNSTSNQTGSIKKRIQEAEAIIKTFRSKKNIVLCGFSMSGQVILNLLEHHRDIQKLILLAPGIYHRDAIDLEFGREFTDTIRQHESWREHNLDDMLQEFTGKLLVIIGDQDHVIPAEIPDLILASAKHATKKELHIIPGAPHMLAGWTQESPENAKIIGDMVCDFIKN